MLRKLRVLVLGVWVACCGLGVARAESPPPPLAALLADDSYREVRISPDGQYLAAIVGNGDEPDELATFSLKEHKLVARFGFRDAGRSVGDYWWVKDHQLVMRPVDRSGYSAEPVFYGTLYAASADGGGFVPIIGFDVGGMQTGTRIKKAESKPVWGEFIADIDGNADSVLLQSTPQESSQGRSADGKVASPLSKVQRVKLSTGVAIDQMAAPAPDARFIASPSGVVHFAVAIDANAVTQVYRYHHEREQWSLLASNPTAADLVMLPQTVSADGRYAWYLSSQDVAQKALFRVDLQSGARDKIFEDASRPVEEVLADPYSGVPYAVLLGQQLSYAPIDDAHPLAKASAALFKAFPDGRVEITSVSRDRSTAVARVSSERDPGVWYTVDLNSRKINLELTNLADVDPEALLATRAVSLKARDGLGLSGYYTAPAKTGDARPPLVVLVHGGPYEVADRQEFDPWVQTLATRGYAVLQVNFRGSGGQGDGFVRAGYGEWGRKMQDDVTDATRWAIDNGMADPARIAIMGASYGGYASLMGVVREPALYRCAISISGVTDLKLFMSAGDIPDQRYGKSYLLQAIGDDSNEWKARSPLYQADKIKVPVLLISGTEDQRVPIEHSKRLEAALKQLNMPVETLYLPKEAHGFYRLNSREQLFQRTLQFLGLQLSA